MNGVIAMNDTNKSPISVSTKAIFLVLLEMMESLNFVWGLGRGWSMRGSIKLLRNQKFKTGIVSLELLSFSTLLLLF